MWFKTLPNAVLLIQMSTRRIAKLIDTLNESMNERRKPKARVVGGINF